MTSRSSQPYPVRLRAVNAIDALQRGDITVTTTPRLFSDASVKKPSAVSKNGSQPSAIGSQQEGVLKRKTSLPIAESGA